MSRKIIKAKDRNNVLTFCKNKLIFFTIKLEITFKNIVYDVTFKFNIKHVIIFNRKECYNNV